MVWRVGANWLANLVTPLRDDRTSTILLPPPPEGPGGAIVVPWEGKSTLSATGAEATVEMPLYDGSERGLSLIPGGAWGQGSEYTQWSWKGLLCWEEKFLSGRLGARLLGGVAGSHTAPADGLAEAFDAVGAGTALELRGDPWPNWSIVAGLGALHPVSGRLDPMADMQPRAYVGFRRAWGATAPAVEDGRGNNAAKTTAPSSPSAETPAVWDAIQEAKRLIELMGKLATPEWFDAYAKRLPHTDPSSPSVRSQVIGDGLSWFLNPTQSLGDDLPPLVTMRETFAAQIAIMHNRGSPRAAEEAGRLEHQFQLLPAAIAKIWYARLVAGQDPILEGLKKRGKEIGEEIKKSTPDLAVGTVQTMVGNYEAAVSGLRLQVRNLQLLLLFASEPLPHPTPAETETLLKCLAYGKANDCPPDFDEAISVPALRAAIQAKAPAPPPGKPGRKRK